MALIKLGPNVAGISGSTGGSTYARNRAGSYIRNRTKPVIPVSNKRALANARMTSLIAYWQDTMTDAERIVWNNAAIKTQFPNRLGDAFTPTGMNLFLRSNCSLDSIGEAIVNVPPVQPIAQTFAPTLVHTPATGIEITAVGLFDIALSGNILWQPSTAFKKTVNYFKGPWASLNVFDIVVLAGLPYTLVATADLQINSRYFFRFVTVLDDGAVASPAIVSAVVGPVA